MSYDEDIESCIDFYFFISGRISSDHLKMKLLL